MAEAATAAQAALLHPVRTASVTYIVLCAFGSPRLFLALTRYLYTVSRYFFLAQYRFRARPSLVPLVSIDHELDELVPFEPERVGIYLGFIHIWVAALSYARKRLGRISNAELASFLDGLSLTYLEAYGVYRRCVSTTRRPPQAANASLGMIYTVDPHLFCLPSLHVMIVNYAWLRFREIYRALGREEEGRDAWEDLYRQAVLITDTVVYVKQHSVSCIPAALFMTTRMRPDFGPDLAFAFIEKLFLDPVLPDRPRMVAYMRDLYQWFMDEADRRGGDYREVLVDFLMSYPSRIS